MPIQRDLVAAVRSLDAAHIRLVDPRTRLGFPPGTAHRRPVVGASSRALRGPGCVQGKDVERRTLPVDQLRPERGGSRRDDHRGRPRPGFLAVGRVSRRNRCCRWCRRGQRTGRNRIGVRPDHGADYQEPRGDRDTAHHRQTRAQTFPQDLNPPSTLQRRARTWTGSPRTLAQKPHPDHAHGPC